MSIHLKTSVSISPSPRKISHDKYLLLLGSCFSEHIGEKLQSYLFRVCNNPTGVLYNPSSIISAVNRINSQKPFTKNDIFYHQGLWKSWEHHSRFAHSDPDIALENINTQLEKAIHYFKNLDFLIFTPGTASVYYNRETGKVVSNCHKLPQQQFQYQLLTPDSIVHQFSSLIDELISSNPSLTIGFSLSPVRYIRDSMHQNQVSKSHLMSAIYALEQKYPQVYYFPAYEIMMDELRDYRFYNQDMIHPNETAISIIWERFQQAYLSERAISFVEDYTNVILAREHRIQFPDLESTKKFAISMIQIISKLKDKYSDIDLSNDLKYFQSLL